MKSSLWRQGVEQQVLVASVSLAQKTLHAVTVDGVAELAFRHTEQHCTGGWCSLRSTVRKTMRIGKIVMARLPLTKSASMSLRRHRCSAFGKVRQRAMD